MAKARIMQRARSAPILILAGTLAMVLASGATAQQAPPGTHAACYDAYKRTMRDYDNRRTEQRKTVDDIDLQLEALGAGSSRRQTLIDRRTDLLLEIRRLRLDRTNVDTEARKVYEACKQRVDEAKKKSRPPTRSVVVPSPVPPIGSASAPIGIVQPPRGATVPTRKPPTRTTAVPAGCHRQPGTGAIHCGSEGDSAIQKSVASPRRAASKARASAPRATSRPRGDRPGIKAPGRGKAHAVRPGKRLKIR
jgi:hypothetical protein